MFIGDREIGRHHPPFIIAEMSGNHNQSLDNALKIVEAAAAAGAHALKIQTYTADTMTLDLADDEFLISDPNSLWKGESLYKLYQKAHTPWEWHQEIFEYARNLGLIVFSSPFDESAVDFLESLDVPCYKIASFENTDIPLIRKVAETGKPIIISTGMATAGEIEEAINTARSAGSKDIILLKCTSTYPATPDNTNINTIPNMRDLFGCETGISDHTMGIGVAVASVALGATVIEKHLTLSRKEGGVDAEFSMESDEFRELVIETKRAWQALGQIKYGPYNEEKKSLVFRRSLYVVEDLKAGDFITDKNVRSIRPGYGLPTKFKDILIGMRVVKEIRRGTPLSWDLIRKETN